MKRLILIVIVFLLLLGIPATVYLVGQQQELRKKAAPATTLSLVPATATKKVGDIFALDITIDTGENRVVAAEIHLIFDPEKLEAQTITNSTLFPNILTSGVVDHGTASITVGASDVNNPINGKGTVAVVRLKALAQTDAPVSVRFAQNTYVGGLQERLNVLVGTTPGTISITRDLALANSTPSPTPTIRLTPTSTPGITPATTPTPSLTPTATNSPQASGSAVQISAPSNNASVTSTTPTIRGKATPGSSVTLTIYSTPQTVVIQTDSLGNWSYTPTTPLTTGPHNIVASSTDSTGNPVTASTSFVIASGGTTSASQSAIPISGNTSWTFLAIMGGLTLFIIGCLLPTIL